MLSFFLLYKIQYQSLRLKSVNIITMLNKSQTVFLFVLLYNFAALKWKSINEANYYEKDKFN